MADSSTAGRPWSRFFAQPINRLLIASFVVIAVVPVAILAAQLYAHAWDDAWREINEKHKLLALNLAAPISIYVNDHRAALRLVSASLEEVMPTARSAQAARLLDQAQQHLPGFRSLTLVEEGGFIIHSTAQGGAARRSGPVFADERCFRKTYNTGQSALSGIKASPVSGKPVVILSESVESGTDAKHWVLLGELRPQLIEDLRQNIHFGERGHSAIVDQNGRVIAHPNPEWMRQMRDLSDWPIVQRMMAGETGVAEFYSTFVGEDMVAGFSAVPEIGWGVMVPQPKAEVQARVEEVLHTQLAWGLVGLAFALVLAVVLARWITSPLNRLAGAASELTRKNVHGRLPRAGSSAPREVRQLAAALDELIRSLQFSRAQFDRLDRSLQNRVEHATRDLREANVQLERQARHDYLTSLANRRDFEENLTKSLQRRRLSDQWLCLILMDVDNFKEVNDHYGHAAGDAVLVQLADLLRETTRQADIVARYGGDEFVVKLECPQELGRQRAAELLEAIRQFTFHWHGEELHLTVSVGLLCQSPEKTGHAETLLQRIDAALYQAKRHGRNQVVELDADDDGSTTE